MSISISNLMMDLIIVNMSFLGSEDQLFITAAMKKETELGDIFSSLDI